MPHILVDLRALRHWVLTSITLLLAIAPAQAQLGGPGRGPSAPSSIVGIVVKLQDEAVVNYAGTVPGFAATRAVPGTARFNARAPVVQAYRGLLSQRHAAFEAAARAAVPLARVTHRFDVVFGGVAMRVPKDQIAQIARLPGVVAVYRDPMLPLHTDSTPQFIGAPVVWGRVQGFGRAGEGVVVGVLDTGVWPEHPSFRDPDPSGKRYPPPAIVPTQCAFSGGANPGPAFSCNNKLIGAYRFMATYDQCVADGDCPLNGDYTSARDSDGHGTHTTSTAAGNAKVESQIFGIPRKQVSGIAPRAQVIAYKVCGPVTCWGSDSMAAVQHAVLDGVDVINFSIGVTPDPYSDVVELAFLDAYAAGIFVAASAGNSGPGADTVEHRGPWVTTVGASTENRSFDTTLSLVAADGAKLKLPAVSVTPAISTPLPVVSNPTDQFCNDGSPLDLTGKIVVCARGGLSGRQQKSFNVAQRGAAGMILYNLAENQELLTDNHIIPSVHIARAAAELLDDFLAAHTDVTGTFAVSVARNAVGDVMAQFSSRGGTESILGISKPDITAPGLQVLAGQTPYPDNPADPKGQFFQAIAGTSMSSPHVAGAAALVRSLHPDWTPGQIKSALMTTASTAGLVEEDGTTVFTPFDAGSGRVNLAAIPTLGLTFDVPASDYVDHAADLWNVNYPSIYIPDVAPNVLSVSRIAKSVASPDSLATTWTLTVVPDKSPGMEVSVVPFLTVPSGGSTSFDVRIDKTAIPAGEARHATLQLSSSLGRLHLPVSAAGPVLRPDLVVTEAIAPATGTRGELMSTTATVKNIGAATATRFYFQVYLSPGNATVSPDDTPYWYWNIPTLAPGAMDTRNLILTIPTGIVRGTYYLVVRADDGAQVSESNESNNVAASGPIAID
jgi:subtilisin family serine protease